MQVKQKKLFLSMVCLLTLIWWVGSASAMNLVVNGDFQLGNQDFTSAYTYVSSPGDRALWDESTYAIGNNPLNYHSSWVPGFLPCDGTEMMIVNGATKADVKVWTQSVTVAQNTQYYFSAYVASSYPTSPAILDFSINGQSIGTIHASATVGEWQLFYATWYSGSNGEANLALVNQNTIANGNDFALDNIRLDTSSPVPVPSTVLLLGSGLVGLGLLRRRWSLKK